MAYSIRSQFRVLAYSIRSQFRVFGIFWSFCATFSEVNRRSRSRTLKSSSNSERTRGLDFFITFSESPRLREHVGTKNSLFSSKKSKFLLQATVKIVYYTLNGSFSDFVQICFCFWLRFDFSFFTYIWADSGSSSNTNENSRSLRWNFGVGVNPGVKNPAIFPQMGYPDTSSA